MGKFSLGSGTFVKLKLVKEGMGLGNPGQGLHAMHRESWKDSCADG